jgi:purine-binding chemotaxis protein CheW
MPATNETAADARADARAGPYLTFQLGHREFGIRALNVREIMGLQKITAVPRTPAHVKGVIDLRGKAVPVIDLRLKLGMPAAAYGRGACIVVTQTHAATGPALMGIVVDGVSEVLHLAAAEIEDVPNLGEEMAAPYLLGLAKVRGSVKTLLDIDKALASQDLHNLSAVLNR